ncbi:MAG: hypothetical protein OEO23_01835 [Gemmatimonadota bacterium]|nr:hypothetical protein [Gemmatimonadota bacterium]
MTLRKKPAALPEELTMERIRLLKERMQSDYYDAPGVVDAIIDRLLVSGDLVDARE